MNPAEVRRRILVTGDAFLDRNIYVGHESQPHTSQILGTRSEEAYGGAALLAEVVRRLLPQSVVTFGLDTEASGDWPRRYAVFDQFPADRTVPKGGQVWRMREPLGVQMSPSPSPWRGSRAAEGEHDTIVIDDGALTFRRYASRSVWPAALGASAAHRPDWLVLNLHAPIAAGDFWHHLVAGSGGLLERCVAVLTCRTLRTEQVRISRGVSWERTALDLAGEFLRNPTLVPLRRCRFVVVRFSTDGALLADFSLADRPEFRLVFDPAYQEGDWSDRRVGRRVHGTHTPFTAAVAAAVAGIPRQDPEARSRIEAGIKAGLAVVRRLLLSGYGPADGPPAFPWQPIGEELGRSSDTSTYSVASVPYINPRWSIVGCEPSGALQTRPLYGLARRVALNGASALRGVPFQRFGKLFIVDRGEIESLRGLSGLVRDYVRQKVADRPLSIAVFGVPGAGKSFGVKQLARAVLGKKVPILEFNLAQFETTAELLGLLHQVRDKVLEGRTPVVFWDEFDSRGLEWLQYLLAPMQDGKVQDGQISHPIGKCIFVFAGGTSSEFGQFGPPEPDGDAWPQDWEEWDRFRARKGPDFKSRLNGYLNVLGPNPRLATGKDDPPDVAFPLRRALMLRSKLDLEDERLRIDRGVLTALLEVTRYRHGSRSMEKIIDQIKSAMTPGDGIRRSHLPPRQLLQLHVDADEFLGLVERDLAYQFDVEPMARAYHEFYVKLARGRKGPIAFGESYENLPEHMKDDNRAAARRVTDVLGLIGLYAAPIGPPTPRSDEPAVRRAIEQNLELLAEAEHDGWMEYRLRNGWRKGERKIVDERVHHLLVPYADLPEPEKDKDREAVRRYVDILVEANYWIVDDPPRSPATPGPQVP